MATQLELDNARRVHEVLITVIGRANRIDSWELSSRSGVYQPYVSVAARLAGMEIAAPGVVMGSVVGPGGGYFTAETQEEKDDIMKSRLLNVHTRLEKDLDTAERAVRGTRGAARTRAVGRREAVRGNLVQTRTALAEYGILLGEFAEEDATV